MTETETIDVLPVRRALVAVADKAGVEDLARALVDQGAEVVSTGRTAAVLRDAGIPVTAVADVTGFPEMLGGRVKTLHPRIHAGLLADKRNPEHLAALREQGIEPFDLVVVNLYPFREAVARGATEAETIEEIDIGGPAMVRASAKNFESVGVVTDPSDYGPVAEEIRTAGGLTRETRHRLARLAFAHTAEYDTAIARYFTGKLLEAADFEDEQLPHVVERSLTKVADLRYGENPHQRGGLYATPGGPGPLGGARVLQGKEMSFNNWQDAEAARAVASLFDERPVAVIVKHHNPCGVAMADSLAEAYEKALDSDRVSAFGGIVAFNREADEGAARAMKPVFTEVVIAPGYTEGALAAFAERQNLRVVVAPLVRAAGGLDIRPVDDGALVQDLDVVVETRDEMKVATSVEPTEAQWEDLLFAWKVAARVKSNAIVLVRGLATVGVGAGQMNRVISVDIASRQAGERSKGSVLASDAFFPFRDSIDRAAEAGVAAIIQPGGSMRDEEVLAAAEEHGIPMVLTGRRHFRH
jgi:phosphoribosylaminoimidazolecarboxamide formyltransferase/IMP cyclohydrolase